MKKTMAFLLAIITLFLLSAPAFATSNSTWDTVTADDKVVTLSSHNLPKDLFLPLIIPLDHGHDGIAGFEIGVLVVE